MTDQTFRPTSATVDTDHATNELVLRFSTFNPETRDMDTIVVRLAELDGIAFAGETARHGAYLSRDLIRHALVGHCDTCRNIRLVDVPKQHGPGTTSVRCPDCGDRFDNPPRIPIVFDPREATS